MASRSIGSLTADLILKTGGFEAGMDKSARAAEKSLKRIQSTARGIGTAFAALAGFVSFRAIIAASAEAAKNFAQLENAVKNAGEAAGGRSARDFAAFSDQLQSITTFSDDAVQGVQHLLLRFQSIRTDRFDEATKSVLDLATAMGTDADAAAKLLGRALTDPEKGMTALARAGVVFSDQQKKVIKDLVDTGRQAEAQGIILDELGKKFGGAAEAARNNFAGALTGVKNAFDNLLEVDQGLSGATESLNELAKVLQDPAIKAGADSLFSAIISGAANAVEFVAKLSGGLAVLAGYGRNAAVNLDNEIAKSQKRLAGMENSFFAYRPEVIEKERKKLEELRLEYEKLMGLGYGGIQTHTKANMAPAPDFGGAIVLPDITVTEHAEATDKLAKSAAQARAELVAMGKALTDSVQTPLDKYNAAVKEADRLLSAGVITPETWARALGEARGELDGMSMTLLEVSERFKTLDEQVEEFAQNADEQLASVGDDLLASIEAAPDISKQLEEYGKEVSVFADEAKRNMVDIIADGLVDGFDGGIKGMLESFGKMLQRMAAQAVAANIAEKIFGDSKGGSSGGGGGWLSTIAGFFASRDSGGRGQAGVPYMIGTGAQPEIFVPDSAGQFYPNGGQGGGMQISQVFHIQAPQGSVSRQTQQQVGAAAARGISGASRRNN